MKSIKTFFTTIALLLCSCYVNAHDFTVGGIYYRITDTENLKVAVCFRGTYCGEYDEYSGNVVIPSTVSYKNINYSVASIDSYAFYDCIDLNTITIPSCITSIGEHTFQNCKNLNSVSLPNSIISIGCYAFQDCTSLTSISLPNGITSISYGTFYGCNSLTSVNIPNSVTSVGNAAFYGTAWYDNQPDGVVYAGKVAYAWKGTMPSNTSIELEEGCLGVAEQAFNDCDNLISVSLPNSVIIIGDHAFSKCGNLTSVSIGNSVKSIGDNAFSGCRIMSFTSKSAAVPPALGFQPFYDGISSSATLYVPIGSKSIYEVVDGWNKFKNIVEIIIDQGQDNTIITINQFGSGTFSYNHALDFTTVEGIKVYAATGYNTITGTITMTRVNTVKAGTGIFIKGEPGDYNIPVLDYTYDNTLNMLVGTLQNTNLMPTSSDGKYANLIYALNNNGVPMFLRANDDGTSYSSANRAYLQIPVAWLSTSDAKEFNIRFEDEETTSINDINIKRPDENTIYDLQGRRIANPAKGLYILNGKKVFVR